LVCSTIQHHSCLSSVFTLQPVIFILFRSSSTWSTYLNLGLPTGLALYGVHSVIFLVVLVFSILITWAANLKWNQYRLMKLNDGPLKWTGIVKY
jgi:hypothetical protein